jgi:hypothetical protein
MLYAFGFGRIGVLASDLYFVDPEPGPGQEGAERGVRLEVRLLDRGELHGSRYSAQPIEVGQPVWRADLLETADGPPGSLNRAHHHPRFRDWEPGQRNFDTDLKADPVRWVGEQLADLDGLLERAGIPGDEVTAADAKALRESLPEVMDAVGRLLRKVHDGELGLPPDAGEEPAEEVRAGWL